MLLKQEKEHYTHADMVRGYLFEKLPGEIKVCKITQSFYMSNEIACAYMKARSSMLHPPTGEIDWMVFLSFARVGCSLLVEGLIVHLSKASPPDICTKG